MRNVIAVSGRAIERIVLDASIVIELLRGGTLSQRLADVLLDGERMLHAPELLDIEVAHVLRRLEREGAIMPARADEALRLLQHLPISRQAHAPLLSRVWALRYQCTAYDAVYVALAEGLGATLWTLDAKLARAAGRLIATHVPG